MKRDELHFFDKKQVLTIFDQRRLPHWLQSGALCFITWRVADSLPQEVLRQLDAEIQTYLKSLGVNSHHELAELMLKSEAKTRSKVHWWLFRLRDKFLDQSWGRCPLRVPEHAAKVLESLRYRDEERYFLTDAIVMPNHLHFIAAFGGEDTMLKQCTEWKRFTGRMINQMEGRSGEFWQRDQFDHLIRGESQFEYFRQYLRDNPVKAGLKPSEFLYLTKNLTAEK